MLLATEYSDASKEFLHSERERERERDDLLFDTMECPS